MGSQAKTENTIKVAFDLFRLCLFILESIPGITLVILFVCSTEEALSIEERGLRRQLFKLQRDGHRASHLFLREIRSRLERIRREREKGIIRSPVDARVLLIRIHSVQEDKLVVAIKLLINAKEVEDERTAFRDHKGKARPR